jgi:hypothetical protein
MYSLDADFIDRCMDYRVRMASEKRQPVDYQDQDSHIGQRQRRFMWTFISDVTSLADLDGAHFKADLDVIKHEKKLPY